jgi:hypothetical protein
LAFKILRDGDNRVVYADFRKALTLSEGRMPSSKPAHKALCGECSPLNFRVPLWTPVWTRSIVAYPASGMPFGESMVYEDARGARCALDTRPFRGRMNIALVLDDYVIREDSGVFVFEPRAKVKTIDDFPQKPGHSHLFGADPETSLPVSNGPGKVALWRNMHASIVPAVWAVYGTSTPAAWLRYGISGEFGVLVEAGPSSPG